MISPILNKAVKYSGSFTFNGVDEYQSSGTGYSAIWKTNGAFSFKIVFKVDSFVGAQNTLYNNNDGTAANLINVIVDNTGDFRINIRASSIFIQALVSSVISTGVWYIAVITYDGSKSETGIKIFMDGTKRSVTTSNNGTIASYTYAGNWRIAYLNAVAAQFANIKVAEICAWDSELSEARARQYSRWKKQLNYKSSNKRPVIRYDFDTYANPNVNLGTGGSSYDLTPTFMDATNQSTDIP